jgi:hypothetical protein
MHNTIASGKKPNSYKNISQSIAVLLLSRLMIDRVRKYYNLAYTKTGPSKNEFSSFLKLRSFGSANEKLKIHDA